MNLVADESVDLQVVQRLRSDGHDVLYVAELAPGISDDQVLAVANERNALLLTADKDFGELVFRLCRIASGVLLIRLPGLSSTLKAEIVSRALDDHGASVWNAFTVVMPSMVRVRPQR
jgi:predicted nuclease of predicted toxin-antitoxin system